MITILCLLLTTEYSFAEGQEKKQISRWEMLNKLIEKEEKTIKGLGRLGPKLQYRLLELKSEKIRLLKEKENERFLSDKQRRKKSWYFKGSRKLFLEVNKMGHRIIKRYPKFNKIARIYYTLALNERDYGGDKKTEYYLKLALKKAKKRDRKIIHNAKTSLAEYYYNTKNYNLAVKFYDDVIKNKKDDWYTKHLYNQAWCLLKINEMSRAITNLKLSFKESSNPRYIDVKDQVLESFVVFFVHGNQISEGIDFYRENVKDPTDYLISMSKKTAQKGLFKETRNVIKAALGKAKELEKHEKLVEIRLNELEIYRNFKQHELYFNTAKELQKLNSKTALNDENREDAVMKIRSLVKYLQTRLTNNLKLNNKNYDKNKLKEVTEYFGILSSLDKENEDSYSYFTGETYYSVARYEDAAQSYSNAIKVSLKKSPKGKKEKRDLDKLRKKTFKSLLALLGSTKFDEKKNHQHTIFAYENHINIWPVNPTSKKIYNRLFNLYISKKDIDNALGTFEKYKKNYKQEVTHQQAMITKIMDYYITNKDAESLSKWIGIIQKGFLGFKKSYIEKSMAILGKILFESYQNLDKQGKKEVAAEGYIKLFSDERYPKKIKAQSAFNAAVIYLELGKTKNAYEWIKYSLRTHSRKDKLELLPKLRIIVDELALLQDFKRSALLANTVMLDFCSHDYKEKDDLYRMSIHHQLIENNYIGATKNFYLGNKCGIKEENKVKNAQSILLFLTEQRQYKNFFNFYRTTKNSKVGTKLFDEFMSSMIEIYWDTQISNRPTLGKRIKKVLLKMADTGKLNPNQKAMMESIKKFELFSKKSHSIKFSLKGNGKKFNEGAFNQSLEGNLKKLELFTKEGEQLVTQGHKELILGTYIILNRKYLELINKISSFSPRGVPQEFVIGFKQVMGGLTNNLEKKSNSYRLNARKVIHDNDILSYQNFKFVDQHGFIKKINYRYPASKLVSTADTEGAVK